MPTKAIRYLLHALMFAMMGFVAYQNLLKPNVEFGDGREYIIQTQAIVFDRQLAIDPVRRAAYWNETNPFNLLLDATPKRAPTQASMGQARQFGGNFGAVYLDKHGDFRYVHSWVYSLIAAPVYALLHTFGASSSEYQAFAVANVVLILVPIILLWLERPSLLTLGFLVILLASPIAPHLQFAHAEIFCFSCVMVSFLTAAGARGRFVSPFLLGLGAAQNIPIVLFFPLHFRIAQLSQERGSLRLPARELCRILLPYALGVALPLSIIAYNFYTFGTANLIAHLGHASTKFLSVQRMISVYFSPIIGNFWYLPASWLALVIACVCGRYRLSLWFSVSVLAVSTLSSTTSNLNSAQISACRYALWYLAPLYVLPFMQMRGYPLRKPGPFGRASIAASCAVVVLIQIWLGTWRLLFGDWAAFSSVRRATPEVAALYKLTHLHDDIEPIVENLTGSEIRAPHSFSGIYVWNLGDDASLWIISKRALRNSQSIEVAASSDLSKDAAVVELFDIGVKSSSTFELSPKPGIAFNRHPVFGGYLIVWTSSRITGMRSPAPSVIRN